MEQAIKKVCDEVAEFLIAKNRSYGNSAEKPVRIFSRMDTIDQIHVRLDDKLSRIARGSEYQGDDTELDIIGYLILKRAIKEKEDK